MTKHERYKEAKLLLKKVSEVMLEMVNDDEEAPMCYFAAALDKPIRDLIEAKMHMAVAENVESIQNEFRKMWAKQNAEYGRKLRDTISESMSKEV